MIGFVEVQRKDRKEKWGEGWRLYQNAHLEICNLFKSQSHLIGSLSDFAWAHKVSFWMQATLT